MLLKILANFPACRHKSRPISESLYGMLPKRNDLYYNGTKYYKCGEKQWEIVAIPNEFRVQNHLPTYLNHDHRNLE